MSDYLLTTVLEFADRAEGQVLHIGTREDCQQLSDMMPAVMLKGGGDVPLSCRHLIVEAAQLPGLQAGEMWHCKKPAASGEHSREGASNDT